MGYKSPYDKVGKVMPEMKNQSKSSLMMKDASPLGFHGKKHDASTDEFGNKIPEGFKADAPEVIGTVRPLSTTHSGNIVDLEEGEKVQGKDLYKIRQIEQARQGYAMSNLTEEQKKKVAEKRTYNNPNMSASDIARILNIDPKVTTIKYGK
jgi:hypothetical protein